MIGWEEAVAALRAIADAVERRDYKAEAAAWLAPTSDGVPAYGSLAIAIALRPPVVQAIVDGFHISGAEVLDAIREGAANRGMPWVDHEPDSCGDLIRATWPDGAEEVWRRSPPVALPGGLRVPVDQWRRAAHAAFPARLKPEHRRGGYVMLTEDRATITCPEHSPESLATCGCPSMAEFLGAPFPERREEVHAPCDGKGCLACDGRGRIDVTVLDVACDAGVARVARGRCEDCEAPEGQPHHEACAFHPETRAELDRQLAEAEAQAKHDTVEASPGGRSSSPTPCVEATGDEPEDADGADRA